MTAAPASRATQPDVIRLAVPARPEFVQVLRVAVRVVAGRAGCSDDVRSRLQAAVGAAFFEAVDRGEPGARIVALLEPRDDRMAVALGLDPRASALDPTAIAGVADGHELLDGGHRLRLWVTKAPAA